MYTKEREKSTTNGVLHEISKQCIKKDKDNKDDSNRFSKANQNNNIYLTS